MGRTHQPAHSKKTENADNKAPFQLVYGDFMGIFTQAAYGGYKYVNKITD